jgi:hypothetical protein
MGYGSPKILSRTTSVEMDISMVKRILTENRVYFAAASPAVMQHGLPNLYGYARRLSHDGLNTKPIPNSPSTDTADSFRYAILGAEMFLFGTGNV